MNEKLYTEQEVCEWMIRAVERYRTGYRAGYMLGFIAAAVGTTIIVCEGCHLYRKIKKKITKFLKEES